MRYTAQILFASANLMAAAPAIAIDMPALAKQNNCVACHAIDNRVVGPAWLEVSAKYKGATTYTFHGKEYPLLDGLVMKVAKGGSGNWGAMPMPGNAPSVKEADIRGLVQFILGLAK